MTMRRQRILTVLFLAGTIIGFGSGFAQLGARCKHKREAHREHVARICAEAALRARPAQPDSRPHTRPAATPPATTPESPAITPAGAP
jgi:hypothetical protein